MVVVVVVVVVVVAEAEVEAEVEAEAETEVEVVCSPCNPYVNMCMAMLAILSKNRPATAFYSYRLCLQEPTSCHHVEAGPKTLDT